MVDRSYTEAITAEFERVGVTDYSFEPGGKHPRVVYRHQGKRHMYVLPSSPSHSWSGVRDMLSDLRKQLGVTPPVRAKSTRAAKKRIRRDDAPMPETFTVRPDPLAKLMAWKPPSRFVWIRVTNRIWRMEVRHA